MNCRQAARRWPIVAALLLLGCLSAPAHARHHHRSDAAAQPAAFDYYLLALSWSPSFCLTHPDDGPQCAHKGLGFVLHGLWPQANTGGYPHDCSGEPGLSAAARALGETLYPSPTLMQHEWQTHGTCSGMNALNYFQTADRALAVIRIPAMLQAPNRSLRLSSAQIVDAFRAANAAVPADGLIVACSRAQLSEVRVCLTRELQPRACGAGVRNSCPAVPILVPNSR